MVKHIDSMEPAYALHKVTEIDTRLKAIEAEKKKLTEKRKLYAPHLPKKSD